jgi:hypothetical protein
MSSLFGDDPGMEPRKRVPAKRAKTEKAVRKDAGLQLVLEHYYDGFARRFGFKPAALWARDKNMLRPYFDAWGQEATLAAVDTFLDPATTDPRIVAGYNPDFSVQHFVRVAQYLRVSEVAPVPADHKSARTADAVRRAIGGRKK